MRRFWLFFFFFTSCQTAGSQSSSVKEYVAQFSTHQSALNVVYRFPEKVSLPANSPIIVHFSQPMIVPQDVGRIVTDYRKWLTLVPTQEVTAQWRTPSTLVVTAKPAWGADEIEVSVKAGCVSLLGAAILRDIKWHHQVESATFLKDVPVNGPLQINEATLPTRIGEALYVQVTVPKMLRLGDVVETLVTLENDSLESMTVSLSATSDRLRSQTARQSLFLPPKKTKTVPLIFETAALLNLVTLDEVFSQEKAQANLRFEVSLGDRQAIVDRKIELISDVPRDAWHSGGMVKNQATFKTALPPNAESGEVRLSVTEDRLDWAISVAKTLWSKRDNGEATRMAALYPALLFRSEPAFTAVIAESGQGDEAVRAELTRLSALSFNEEERPLDLLSNFSHLLFLADFILAARDAGFDISALTTRFIPHLQKLSLQTVLAEGDYFKGVADQIAFDGILAELGFDVPDAYARHLPFWDHLQAVTKARLVGLLVRSNPAHAYVKQWMTDLSIRQASFWDDASTSELWESYQSLRRINPNDQDISPVLLRTLIERGGFNQTMWTQVVVLKALSSYTGDIRLSEKPSRVVLSLNDQILTEFNLINGRGHFTLPSEQLPKNMNFSLQVKEGGPVYMTIERRHRLKHWRAFGLEKGLILSTNFVSENGQNRLDTLPVGAAAFLAVETYFDEATSAADLSVSLPAGVMDDNRQQKSFVRDLSSYVETRESLQGRVHFTLANVPRGYWRLLIPIKAVTAGRFSWPMSHLEAADASGRVAESAASVMGVR